MKKIIFLLLISNCSFAQFPFHVSPNKYDKFIEQPEITWACYRMDTIRFSEANLSDILRERFSKGEIKVADPLRSIRDPIYDTVYYMDKNIFDNRHCSMIFSPGGYSSYGPCHYRFDSTANNFFNVIQILYVEKGKLKSFIPWVSPFCFQLWQDGTPIGLTEYCSASFNTEYNFAPQSNDKVIYLGKSYWEMFPDSIPKMGRLKEYYGRNLIEELWPFISTGKYDFFSGKENKKLSVDEVNMSLMIPEWKSSPMTLSEIFFKKLGITQKWYYDKNSNIVYNTIQDIMLFTFKWGANQVRETEPILKIVFKN